MEAQLIAQNIQLIGEFDEYMWADPDNRWPLIPQEAHIVMALDGDEVFNSFTRDIAVTNKDPECPYVEARKIDTDWVISPMNI